MEQSILLIPVPESEAIVSRWRYKYDRSSHFGIPAHITVLFPFIKASSIDNQTINKLRAMFSSINEFSFTLAKIKTFPNVIYLEPNPRDKFIEITNKIVEMFPKYLPYEGKYSEINPHLTLGHEFLKDTNIEIITKEIAEDLHKRLPIHAYANKVYLMEQKGKNWFVKSKFYFKK